MSTDKHKPGEQDAGAQSIHPAIDNTAASDNTAAGDKPAASEQVSTPKGRWYHPWGLFKLCVRTVVYVPLALLIIAALILGTGFGARSAIALAVKFVPNLKATYVEGTLNKALTLADVAWSMDGIDVKADNLHLGWQPSCLLTKRLCVNALDIQGLEVAIDTASLPAGEPKPEPEEPSGPIELPFSIALDSAVINQADIRVDAMRFGATRLDAAAEWDETLVISKLSSQGLSVFIPPADAPAGEQVAATTTAQVVTDAAANAAADANKAETGAVTTNTQSAPDAANPGTAYSGTANPGTANAASANPVTSATAAKAATGSESDANSWPLAQLPEVVLPLNIDILGAELADTSLDIAAHQEQINLVKLSALMLGSSLNIRTLEITHPEASLSLKGMVDLSKDYPLDIALNASADSPKILPELGKQALSLNAKGSMTELALSLGAKGTVELNLSATAKPANPELPFTLSLEAARAGWPLKEPEYLAEALKLNASGTLNGQSAELSGKVTTPFNAPLTLDAKLQHENQKLDIASFSADGELGKLSLDGFLDYQKALSWQANVVMDNIQPSKIILPEGAAPLPSGSVSGRFANSGTLDFADENALHWQVALEKAQLNGELDGFPVTAAGSVSVNDQLHLSARDFELTALGAKLVLSGETKERWAFLGELNAPDLSSLGADFDGTLNARFEVSGAQKAPLVSLNASGDGLLLGGVSLTTLNIKGLYQPLSQHEFSLSAKAEQVNLAGRKLESLTVGAKGDLNRQSLTAQTFGDLVLATQLQSEFDDKRRKVNATLSSLNLGTEFGAWTLSQPMRFNWQLDINQGLLSAACLNHEHSNLCLVKDAVLGERGDIQLSYRGEPGKVIDKLLPKNVDWLGQASLDSTVRWSGKTKPSGELSLVLSPGEFTMKRPKGQIVELGYQDVSLKASLTPAALVTDLTFLSERLASINSHIEVAVTPDRRLDGQINLERVNLAPLKEFLPQLDTLEGVISSELSLAGSLMQPNVSGHLALKNAAFSASSNPTLLSNLNLAMNFAGQQASLSGNWLMGNGDGGIDGTLAWPDGKFSGELAVKGNKLAVIVPPMALLDVSPDLKLTFDSAMMDVKGSVNIPTGQIKIVQLADGGVAVSSDVVFNDSIAQAAEQTSPYGVTADLNIRVGDEIRIDGMGLHGKLDGTLRLQQQAFKPPLLFGEVKVKSGTYKFMGQTLKIPKGEVQFVGPPQLPNLNIEAVREIKEEDMVAGVRITGTGMAPLVTLFSNPSKEQAEILSYILKGKGFDANGTGDNNAMMMSAALSVSSSLSGGAINNIGSTATSLVESFGFSNVQLDANDDGKVAISGYIGENLMVKYGVGVFNPGYEMTVRYYLLSQLYLETVSGTLGQSLDIYYNFDL
ncbi:translocation/assembly module TamB domain-containing protein [Shewanella sp. JM162201]|uniref:Translocation/assembly module TamB domain-containing protein n=1 Tax=Shewanella jiangmenensis TaxID=2837387 RepID=A0ABS5VA26_9GAMM|nr:translocation/assembly module TamB domain-containing protein [Shewanella jiangmenensis]MBT1445888.1 translocation/assembly module TamB domain-containing protein [Shewanella jiangmenensis]